MDLSQQADNEAGRHKTLWNEGTKGAPAWAQAETWIGKPCVVSPSRSLLSVVKPGGAV